MVLCVDSQDPLRGLVKTEAVPLDPTGGTGGETMNADFKTKFAVKSVDVPTIGEFSGSIYVCVCVFNVCIYVCMCVCVYMCQRVFTAASLCP